MPSPNTSPRPSSSALESHPSSLLPESHDPSIFPVRPARHFHPASPHATANSLSDRSVVVTEHDPTATSADDMLEVQRERLGKGRFAAGPQGRLLRAYTDFGGDYQQREGDDTILVGRRRSEGILGDPEVTHELMTEYGGPKGMNATLWLAKRTGVANPRSM